MNRHLLTPRWMALHVAFVLVVIATGLLAWWQWDRAHEAGGSFQNLGYALQWPLFGAFAIFFWVRLARMDLQEQRGEVPPGGTEQTPEAVASAAEQTPEASNTGLESGTPVSPRRRRPLVPPKARPVDSEEDPELAAYNQYLAELNERADPRTS